MNHVSTGFGLCVLGLGIAAWPVVDRLVPRADAGIAPPAATIAAAATAQVAPTIVWYGVTTSNVESSGNAYGQDMPVIVRAWSDGRIEATRGYLGVSAGVCRWNTMNCSTQSPWVTVSSPNQGYSAAADLDFNGRVDGADLGLVISSWGDAPRHDIPPSDCPLNLINP